MEQILIPTYGMGWRVYWAYIWRSFAISFLMGIVAGLLIAIAGGEKTPLGAAINMLNGLLGIAIGIYLVRIVFQKTYSYYTVEAASNATNEPIAMGFANYIALWWSWLWRSLLIIFAMVVPAIGIFAAISANSGSDKAGEGLLIGLLLALYIIGAVVALLFINAKIVQILLSKRYSDFHIRVRGVPPVYWQPPTQATEQQA